MEAKHQIEPSQPQKSIPLWSILIVPWLLQMIILIGIVKYVTVVNHQPVEKNLAVKSEQKTARQTEIARINRLNQQTLIWLCLTSMLPITVLSFLTYHVIIQPINRLKKASVAITRGDLDRTVDVTVDVNIGKFRELQTIAQSINYLADQVQAFSSQLKTKNSELELRIEQYTRELQQAKEQAKAAQSANSSLLADMSHELRSPLNAILGFTQMMQRDSSLSPSQQENLAILSCNGKKLLTSLNYVLELAKIEAGRITLYPNNFDLNSLLDSIKATLQLKAEQKNIKFLLERNPTIMQYIYTDKRRLSQILLNLLENLVHFTAPEGCVTLRLPSVMDCDSEVTDSKKSLKIRFEIEVSNSSISAEELASLFDSVMKIETKRKFQDVKILGLPISRKLVQLMAGDITVNNISEQDILLQAHLQAQLGIATQVQTQQLTRRVIGLEPGQPNYRILVVDDSKTNRKIMLQILEPIGFEVREAVNGQEAVDIWLKWQPDMIWMDVCMPVMDGYEATERIKSYPQQNRATPIVALTASTLEEEYSLSLQAGCDDFVGKPFSESIIFEKIAQHLGIHYIYDIYEESNSSIIPTESQHNMGFKLEADSLKVMPQEWLIRLEEAATELDGELITKLLQEIPKKHNLLAEALQNQVDDFNFVKIINLAQQAETNLDSD